MVNSSVKTGVSIPKTLMVELDRFMKLMKIRSRSKVISEALRSYIAERSWLLSAKNVTGLLVVLYNEKRGETVKRLLDVQHEYLEEIRATMHFHVSHERCLEAIIVKGTVEKIKRLMSDLTNIVGVELVRFIPVLVE